MHEGTGFNPGDRVVMKEFGKWPYGGKVIERYVNDSGIPMLTLERMGYGPLCFEMREDECIAYPTENNQQPETDDATQGDSESGTSAGL